MNKKQRAFMERMKDWYDSPVEAKVLPKEGQPACGIEVFQAVETVATKVFPDQWEQFLKSASKKFDIEGIRQTSLDKASKNPTLISVAAISKDRKVSSFEGEGRPAWTPKGDMASFVEVTNDVGLVLFGKSTWETVSKKWDITKREVIVMSRKQDGEDYEISLHDTLGGVVEEKLSFYDLTSKASEVAKRRQLRNIVIGGGSAVYDAADPDVSLITHCPWRFPDGKRFLSTTDTFPLFKRELQYEKSDNKATQTLYVW